MLRLWNLFGTRPYQESATLDQWQDLFSQHTDRIAKILACIPEKYVCILCGEFSNNFKSRSSTKNHLRGGHSYLDLINFWIQNYADKSPDEIEKLILHNGKVKGIEGVLVI